MAELSPMMKQYMQIKEQNKDSILFFRLGDFYEMFFDDAVLASRELELVLTGRDCGQEERAPMCGVPYHSCEGYIARLVAKGYKVAICEQMEDPAQAKGLVKRDIVRVVTPGTVTESSMLDEARNNYLAVIDWKGASAGLCFVDASTGQLHVTELGGEDLPAGVCNELGRFMPSEVIVNEQAMRCTQVQEFITARLNCRCDLEQDSLFDCAAAEELTKKHFKTDTLESLNLKPGSLALGALGAALAYLFDTQKNSLENINTVDVYTNAQYMHLDLNARRNLEMFETLRGKDKRASLLWVLDKTKTAMGKRLLRSWLEQPLYNCAAISKRLNAVDELSQNNILRSDLFELLSDVHDMERLMTRVVYATAGARELKSLSFTMARMPSIRAKMAGCNCHLLREIYGNIDELEDVSNLIERAIIDDPPISVREGGFIKEGYSDEVDRLHYDMANGKEIIATIEAKERERTGIKNLKVGYNRVFGYYIEVTNSYKGQVPEEYIRKQTLTNCERYITQELKELEGRVLGAKERVVRLEYELFDELRRMVANELVRIQTTAQALAQLDVLCSFAEVSVRNHYCRPDISPDGCIFITQGRHPVVEELLDTPFVPNDTLLDLQENRCAIITGPNMAGKSTYMRQVALIVIMAQAGCFVPASSAQIGLVDAIYTRVGASDDLAGGQSTFMVEMSEVASIVKYATRDSLLILDEIGRGTSTYDGMSIARAVLEYVSSKKLGAKTFFATHYHELTELEGQLQGVKNYNVAVKKRGDDITFLRRIVRGGADDSYGIEVAKLAGVPDAVVERAKQILKELEQDNAPQKTAVVSRAAPVPVEGQITLASSGSAEVMEKLSRLDVNTLTPIEAMNTLFELAKKARQIEACQ